MRIWIQTDLMFLTTEPTATKDEQVVLIHSIHLNQLIIY